MVKIEKKVKIEIGIFAYNEEQNIRNILKHISQQTILQNPLYEVQAYVLANGCTDKTVEIGKHEIEKLGVKQIQMVECPVKGKSETWNFFVHSLTTRNAEFGFFLDSDINIENLDHLQKMLDGLQGAPDAELFSSLPRKDLEFRKGKLSFVEKLILNSSGDLANLKKALCGQLYLARLSAVRKFFVPAGVSGEDGFVKAMVLTDCFRQPEDLDKIQVVDSIFHVFESEKSILGLFNHQIRIVIGTSINILLFRFFSKEARNGNDAALMDELLSKDWLEQFLAQQLPKWPYGYISFHVVTKRFINLKQNVSIPLPKKVLKIFIGGTFDLLVYVLASVKMARGAGAGYW